jgi:DNA-binding PadR family transcriptional regulator
VNTRRFWQGSTGRGYRPAVKADPAADLLPGEWAVLGVLAQSPSHGFAVARTLSPNGAIGRVWSMSRPRVYRAINDLAARHLIEPVGESKSERGPARVTYAVTDSGRLRVVGWLAEPADHVRDVRSDLLLKLAFLDAAGVSPAPLLDAQEALLTPMLANLERVLVRSAGFDAVVLRYRVASIRSVIDFVHAVRPDAVVNGRGTPRGQREAHRVPG